MKLLHIRNSQGETIKCFSCGQQLGKRIMDIKDKSLRCPKCGSILKE